LKHSVQIKIDHFTKGDGDRSRSFESFFTIQSIGERKLGRPNFIFDIKADRYWRGVLRPTEKKWGTFKFPVPPAGLGKGMVYWLG